MWPGSSNESYFASKNDPVIFNFLKKEPVGTISNRSLFFPGRIQPRCRAVTYYEGTWQTMLLLLLPSKPFSSLDTISIKQNILSRWSLPDHHHIYLFLFQSTIKSLSLGILYNPAIQQTTFQTVWRASNTRSASWWSTLKNLLAPSIIVCKSWH